MIFFVFSFSVFVLCDPTCFLKTFYISGQPSPNDIDYELRCWNPVTKGESTKSFFHFNEEFDEIVDGGTNCDDWSIQYDFTNFNLQMVGTDTSKVDFCGVILYDMDDDDGREKKDDRHLPSQKYPAHDDENGCSCSYNVSNSGMFAYVTVDSSHQTEQKTTSTTVAGCSCEMYTPGDLTKVETVTGCDKSSWKVTNTTTAVFVTQNTAANSDCEVHLTWKKYSP